MMCIEEDFDTVVKVHMYGTCNSMHHAACLLAGASPRKANQPRAAIVNTVSTAGPQGKVSQVNYGSGQGRYRRHDRDRQPRVEALRRTRQLPSPPAAQTAW